MKTVAALDADQKLFSLSGWTMTNPDQIFDDLIDQPLNDGLELQYGNCDFCGLNVLQMPDETKLRLLKVDDGVFCPVCFALRNLKKIASSFIPVYTKLSQQEIIKIFWAHCLLEEYFDKNQFSLTPESSESVDRVLGQIKDDRLKMVEAFTQRTGLVHTQELLDSFAYLPEKVSSLEHWESKGVAFYPAMDRWSNTKALLKDSHKGFTLAYAKMLYRNTNVRAVTR